MQGHERKVFGSEPCMICAVRPIFEQKLRGAPLYRGQKNKKCKALLKSPGSRTTYPKTNVVAVVAGLEVAAVCGAAMPRNVGPGATA